MNPGRFFLPNFSTQFSPFMGTRYLPGVNRVGFLSRITSSIKRFNWSGLLNGANKTLNVVNQTIPLVRQAGPMVSNMKNMFRIAKAFGNETTRSSHTNVVNSITNENYANNENKNIQTKENSNNNYPNFFI